MNNHVEGTTPDGVAWKIHYEVCGSGDDLILLHGGGPGATGRSNYGKNIDALARAFRVWVIDFPGWGQSSKNLNAFGGAGPFQNGARAVIAFMDALGIGRAHLVGNSFGGSAALCVAMEQPQRVNRLVLMGPGGGTVPGATGPTEGIRQLQGYYLGEGPTLEKLTAFIGNLVYDSSLITPELIRQRFEASADPAICANPPIVPRPTPPGIETFISRDPRLASVAHRALFIWGQQDKVNPAAGIDSFKVMPNADYVLLNHCGHWAQWEHPERFNDLVLSFLRNP
ncbi:alpha/beta fold hydrolase [Hydrogenophaga sp. NH-16]|uniref:alpha/beta fold hydrolase n=1 Tax=Hydrogenophaga sp. NH-16 TaxID=2184519 RepID=UPI000FDC9CB0|nr:alpha/beta fold hydrolase [Hydrogenophaga sp. NH-16]